MERPESVLHDPSRLKIKCINPSYISSSALFDCAKYFLEINPNNFGAINAEA